MRNWDTADEEGDYQCPIDQVPLPSQQPLLPPPRSLNPITIVNRIMKICSKCVTDYQYLT